MIHLSSQLLAQAEDSLRTGLEPSYYHRFPFSPWVSALVLLGAILFILLVSRRDRTVVTRWQRLLLVSLRIALVTLTLFMMHGWMRQQHVTDLPDLVILLDNSASMDLEDSGLAPADQDRWSGQVRQLLGDLPLSRFELARAGLLKEDGRLLDSLADLHQLKFFTLGKSLQLLTPDPDGVITGKVRQLEANGSSSRLGSAVLEILQLQRGRPTTAIIVISDGTTTEGPSIASVPSSFPIRPHLPQNP